jgi:hypothetical protein
MMKQADLASPPSYETRLAAMLQLEQRARAAASTEELAFLMVNDTHALLPYRQAVLWQRSEVQGDGAIIALSGLAVPDRNAPFNVWLAALLAAESQVQQQPGVLRPPESERGMWQEHLPPHAWALPLTLQLPGQPDEPAMLVLLRDEVWQRSDTVLLSLLADAYAHAWRALETPRRLPLWHLGCSLRLRSRERRWWLIGAAALLVLLCLPVRQSVLAPAEVVARAPLAIRAPLQGIVDRIAVQPNQAVKAGQLLVALDARELESRVETSRQGMAVAAAELRQGQQQALFDERGKAALTLLQGKRDQAEAEQDYLAKALARTQLRAERDGTALFDDPADWVGKPVAMGERIMLIADPLDTELEVQLPVADAIELPPDSPIQLFLNTAPATPLAASLLRVAYRAGSTAEGGMAYRVRARFDAQEHPRIGLKGTAKLYGKRTLLAVYLLRRPLATLRVWLGI